jgi:hypothetical protein
MSVSDHDYLKFRDDVIVALADDVEPPGLATLRLIDLCERHKIPFQETWIMLLPTDLEESGYAVDYSTHDGMAVQITGKGVARATQLRRAKEPADWIDRVHGLNWSTWGGIAGVVGVIIAIIALFVSS